MTFKTFKEMLKTIEDKHPNIDIDGYEIIIDKWDDYTWNRYLNIKVDRTNKEITIIGWLKKFSWKNKKFML